VITCFERRGPLCRPLAEATVVMMHGDVWPSSSNPSFMPIQNTQLWLSRIHCIIFCFSLTGLHFGCMYRNLTLLCVNVLVVSRGSSVSIVTWLRPWPWFEFRRGWDFSPRHRVLTYSGAHPVSFPVVTGDSFPGSKAAGASRWPLTFI